MVDDLVEPLAREDVDLYEADGRVLALDATARVDVPGFRRAAMDGYAVVAEETFGATPDAPRLLEVVDQAFPAAPSRTDVRAGTCVRIMTGAPVPDGADAVVPVEQSEREADVARIHAAVTPGRHVGGIGEDVQKGMVVLRAGRRLRAQDLGLLASLGFAQVPVIQRPRVALIATGNELLPAGSTPSGHKIVDSNTPMLASLVRRDGGRLLAGPIVPDDRDRLAEAMLASAEQADLVLVAGGSSVGQEDHAPILLDELGELVVHGIAMRPSSPAGLGVLGGKPVFLLPGNPVSCLCAYDFFAGRAVRGLAGRHPGWPHVSVHMPLARKISSALGRTDYVRASIEKGRILPLAIRGASILSSTVRARGFVIVDKNREGYAEGETVEMRLY